MERTTVMSYNVTVMPKYMGSQLMYVVQMMTNVYIILLIVFSVNTA